MARITDGYRSLDRSACTSDALRATERRVRSVRHPEVVPSPGRPVGGSSNRCRRCGFAAERWRRNSPDRRTGPVRRDRHAAVSRRPWNPRLSDYSVSRVHARSSGVYRAYSKGWSPLTTPKTSREPRTHAGYQWLQRSRPRFSWPDCARHASQFLSGLYTLGLPTDRRLPFGPRTECIPPVQCRMTRVRRIPDRAAP